MAYPKTRQCKHGHTKHGGKSTPEYTAWAHMVQRITNPKCQEYVNYGGRGLSMDEQWIDFSRFFADMGPKPSPLHSLERRDNSRGYFPDNCYWATFKEQARNTRRNRWITWNGRTQLLIDWIEELGKPKSTIMMRLRRGWSIERAFTT